MNGLEKIIQRIHGEAQAEIAALEAETEQQVAALTQEYQEKARAEGEAVVAQGLKAARQRRERMLSAAQMEGRKMELSAKQQVLDEAFQLALDKLRELPDDAALVLLVRLAGKASPEGRGELVFSPEDRERLGSQVIAGANKAYGASFTLSEETRPLAGGFVLKKDDMEVNCAYEALVRGSRESLEQEAAGILFS